MTAVTVKRSYPYAEELYPLPVVLRPTLVFSIKILSPTLNGKPSLKPVAIPKVTSLVVLSNVIELIPTPLLLLIGTILGVTLYIPNVFLLILTSLSPILYSISTSLTILFVYPSKTIRSGGTK